MEKYKVGDLVNVRLSHSRVMAGLIIETKKYLTDRQTTYVVHDMQDNRVAHALEIDMEMLSESR